MTDTKLSYLLTKFNKEQREELCRRLSITTDTFYRRRNHPGTFSLDDAVILEAYLVEINGGKEVDVYRLFREVIEVPMGLDTTVAETKVTAVRA